MSDVTKDIIKVSASSNVRDVAATIAKSLPNGGSLQIRAIGAGAVNQTAKAIAVARGMLASRALDLWCRIGFVTVQGEDGDISALVFSVDAR